MHLVFESKNVRLLETSIEILDHSCLMMKQISLTYKTHTCHCNLHSNPRNPLLTFTKYLVSGLRRPSCQHPWERDVGEGISNSW